MANFFFFNSLACDSGLFEWGLWIMQPCACLVNVNTGVAFGKGQLVLLHGCLPVAGCSPSAYKGSRGCVYVPHCIWEWWGMLAWNLKTVFWKCSTVFRGCSILVDYISRNAPEVLLWAMMGPSAVALLGPSTWWETSSGPGVRLPQAGGNVPCPGRCLESST